MSKNICRPLVIYNDFLPPKQDVHKGWQYLSFGYNDGITVGDDLFRERSSDLRAMWDYYVHKHVTELDGSFSAQVIFGLRNEELFSPVKDADFWAAEHRKKAPFLFISLIQLDKSSGKNSWNNRMEFEQYMNASAEAKAITYLTFDGSDLILVLLCRQYITGMKIIDGLRNGKDNAVLEKTIGKVKYSFTVGAVYREFLADEKLVSQVEGTIPHVYIHTIEKVTGGMTATQKKLAEKFGNEHIIARESVLGCNDEVILLNDIPWKKFLELYRDKTGILNHSSEHYKNMLVGVTTIIGEEQKNRTEPLLKKDDSNEMSLCECMRNRCNKAPLFTQSEYNTGLKSNLSQAINSLQKFETTPFSDYLFQAAFLPLYMVICMADDVKDVWQKEHYYYSVYAFIKEFNLFAQNSVRSDRQFIQAPDLNVKLYEAPIKLNAFYNAFIFYLKKYLSELENLGEEKHEYEFLICPGATNNMQVQELFKNISDTKRLLIVEIPESQVYDPKVMLIMLAHEVGHVVGKGIRNREGRWEYAVQIAVRISINYVRIGLEQYLEKEVHKSERESWDQWKKELNWEEYWKTTEKKVCGYLKEFVQIDNFLTYMGEEVFTDLDKEKLMSQMEGLKKKYYYSDNAKNILSQAVEKILQDEEKHIWPYLLEKYFLLWLKKGGTERAERQKEALRLEISQWVFGMNTYSLWNKRMFSVSAAIDEGFYLFRECIADLISILTLQISMKEYLSAIIQSVEDQGFEGELEKSILQIRISLVTFSMQSSVLRRQCSFSWGKKDLKEIEGDRGSNNEKLRAYKDSIVNFIRRYLNQDSEKSWPEKTFGDASAALYDTEILVCFIKYLRKCRCIFEEKNVEEKQDQQSKLCHDYNIFNEENIENVGQEIQNVLEVYLKELKTERIIRIQEETG